MAGGSNGSLGASGAGLPGVIDLFAQACEAFGRSLGQTDTVQDEMDFAGSLHELGFNAGRVRALGEALTLLTGSLEWIRQADELLAEYMRATQLPEDDA